MGKPRPIIQDGFETMCPARAANVRRDVHFGPPIFCPAMSCPQGSYCDATMGGTTSGGRCRLECDPTVPALRCPNADEYCTCDGRCLLIAGAPPGGEPPAPACPRSATLLDELKTTRPRVCRFDDECPYGAHCNRARNTCDFACKVDTDCTVMGEVCNCTGRCAPPAAVDRPIPRAATLDVQPRHFSIPPPAGGIQHVPNWGSPPSLPTRTLPVNLTVSGFTSVDNSDPTYQPVITVQPDPNLQVKCEELNQDGTVRTMDPMGNPIPPAQFQMAGQPCSLRYWDYRSADLTGAAPMATNRVTAQPVAPALATDKVEAWTVRFGGVNVNGSPVVVRFAHSERELSAGAVGWTNVKIEDLPTGNYQGTITMRTPLGGRITQPVKARIVAGGGRGDIYILDESRLVSLDGLFGIHKARDTHYEGVWFEKRDQLTDAVIERMRPFSDANFDDQNNLITQLQRRGEGGPLRGLIHHSWDYKAIATDDDNTHAKHFEFDMEFELKPVATTDTATVPTCDASTTCPSPLVCHADSGLCVDDDVNTMRKVHVKSLSRLKERWSLAMPAFQPASIDTTKSLISRLRCASPRLPFDFEVETNPRNNNGKPIFDAEEGDLLCAKDGNVVATGPVPLSAHKTYERAELIPRYEVGWLFRRCWDELRREPPGTLTKISSRDFNHFRGGLLDYQADCLNFGHVLLTLNAKLWADPDPVDGSNQRQPAKVAMRLLQQYLDVTSFALRHGYEEVQLKKTISAGLPDIWGTPMPDPPALVDLMDMADHAFVFFLTELHHIFSVLEEDWKDTDYRRHNVYAECGDSEATRCADPALYCPSKEEAARDRRYECLVTDPTTGECTQGNRRCTVKPGPRMASDVQMSIVPTLLDTVAANYKVVERHLRDLSIQTYGLEQNASAGLRKEAAKRYGRAMQMGLIIEALAVEIQENTKSQAAKANEPPDVEGQPPYWYDRFKVSVSNLTSARQALEHEARILGSAENPLGIPDDDVPLFFGDVSGTNSRYFASSDYLLNSWADPAIKSAQAALQSSRDSWKAARDSELQTALLKQDSERRKDQIAIASGTKILDACGNVSVDGRTVAPKEVLKVFQEKGIKAERCYIKEGKACANMKEVFAKDEEREKFLRRNFIAKAASTALCRMEYMSLASPVDVPEARQAPWNCFLASGTTDYCHTCKDKPLNQQTICYDSCVDSCGECANWEAGNACRAKCHYYPSSYCSGGLRSLWQTVTDWCSEFSLDFPFLQYTCSRRSYSHLKNLTPEQIATTPILARGWADPESKNLNGNERHTAEALLEVQRIMKDCLNRIADPVSPPGRPGNPSLVWQSLSVDMNTLTVTSSMTPPGFAQACSAPVAAFYNLLPDPEQDQVTANDQNGELVIDAVGFCSARGWDVETPRVEVPAGCFGGRIGSAVSAMRAAANDGKAALADLSKLIGDMQDQLRACEFVDMLEMEHRDALHDYQMRRMDAQINGMVFSMVANIASQNYTGIGSVLGSGAAEASIAKEDAAFQEFLQRLGTKEKLFQCRQRVSEIQRGISGARWRAKGALDRAAGGLRDYKNIIEETQREIDSGIAQLRREEERPAGSYAFHFWYDEKVERYRKEFDWAQRLAYLAMRAVEFEFQQSIPLRRNVLMAQNPDQLEDVLRALKQEQASRAINRRRPEETSLVVSVRDDIFQIPDRSGLSTVGERNWEPSQRFRTRLWSQEFEMRNAEGEWMGQAIPFTLRESGVLENRCGERMWRVNATIQGDGLSPLEPGTSVILMKRNTFASQYCRGKGDDQKYQIVSIRPSNQLFKGEPSRFSEEVEGFSMAAIYPWFNVRRNDFYSLKYTEGGSEELAGRGLYGDYVLLFPRQILEKGFPLENVEDVLLRIDYLSVDNLAPVFKEPEPKVEVQLSATDGTAKRPRLAK